MTTRTTKKHVMTNPTANAYLRTWNAFEYLVFSAPHNAAGHVLNIPTENLRILRRNDELLHLRVNFASNLLHHCPRVPIHTATTVKQGFLGNGLQSKFCKNLKFIRKEID